MFIVNITTLVIASMNQLATKDTYLKHAQTFPVGPRNARRGTPTCADILRTSTSVSLVINAPIFIEKIRAT